MALTPSKVLRCPAVADQTATSNRQAILCYVPNLPRCSFHSGNQGAILRRSSSKCYKEARSSPPPECLWGICRRATSYATCRRLLVQCNLTEAPQTKSREDIRHTSECADISGYYKYHTLCTVLQHLIFYQSWREFVYHPTYMFSSICFIVFISNDEYCVNVVSFSCILQALSKYSLQCNTLNLYLLSLKQYPVTCGLELIS